MRTAVTAKKLWDGSRLLGEPIIMIEDGRIASIASRLDTELAGHAAVFDFPGATLAPAFFDVHIHGAAGHDVMEATPEALTAIGSLLAAHGTGSFLATTLESGFHSGAPVPAWAAESDEPPRRHEGRSPYMTKLVK